MVENMAGYVCPDCGAVGQLFAEETPFPSGLVGLPILGRIPFDSRIARCADRGSAYAAEHPDTAAGQALRELGARVSALLVLEEAGR